MKLKISFSTCLSMMSIRRVRWYKKLVFSNLVMVFSRYVKTFSHSCFSDTIAELGGSSELANYGEYSGAPSESQTFEYAKTVLKLMTEGEPHINGRFTLTGEILVLNQWVSYWETFKEFPKDSKKTAQRSLFQRQQSNMSSRESLF